MTIDANAILERIDYLMQVGGTIGFGEHTSSDIAREIYVGTLNLAASLYGPESRQVHAVQDSNARLASRDKTPEAARNGLIVQEMCGTLKAIRNDVESGLMRSLGAEARGEVLGDFVLLGKQALDAGFKDVAAVLACAALEDALKKYAGMHALAVEGKELSDVVNALKGASLIKAPQGKVLQSFVGIRNKAFHAEWDRIEASEVNSVIAFLQIFLAERFG